MNHYKNNLRKQSHLLLCQEKQIHRNKTNKKGKDLYSENCKKLIKETKNNTNRDTVHMKCKELIL